MDTTLDPQAVTLAQSIRQVESNGNFQATGKSGEFGAYQFMPATWSNLSSKYLGQAVPLQQATPQQQNEVAYKQIKDWKDQGFNVGQIASMWNAGPGKPDAYLEGNSGTNSQGVSYNTALYAQRVAESYQKLKGVDPSTLPQATPATPEAPSLGGFAGNVVKSAANLVGGIGEAVLHPIQTVQTLGSTAVGGVEKLGGQTNENTQNFDNVVNFFKQRYGSVDALKQTLYEDPVGVAADLSTVFTGGAGALRLGARGAEVAGAVDAANAVRGAAGIADKAATLTNPLTPVGKLAGRLAPTEQTAQDIYQSALKPTQSVLNKFPNLIETGLKNGVVIGEHGLEKVQNSIEDINNLIDQHVVSSAEKGTTINTSEVAQRLGDVYDFYSKTPLPERYQEAIFQIAKEFQQAHGDTLTVEEAQHMKQATYAVLKKAYGELKSVDTEGLKALARGLKEEIASKVPEVAPLNAKEGELIGLEKALEQFVKRQSNRNFIGVGEFGASAAGALAGGPKGLLFGLLYKALRDPGIKSRLAILIHNAQGIGIGEALQKVENILTALAQGSTETTGGDISTQQSSPQPSQEGSSLNSTP